MQVAISEKSKEAFVSAAIKLGLSPNVPDVSKIREDLGLWIIAKYMLAVIIEAGKNGKTHDITDHSVRKYEPLFRAYNGYVPGSSGGGFSFDGYGSGNGCTNVGARLSSNSRKECEDNAEEYLDLWEIAMLNVK